MRLDRACALLLSCALASCTGAVGLTVDVRTDYAPGTEFTSVQTEVSPTAFTAPTAMGMVVPSPLVAGAHYEAGVRVAELPMVTSGDFYVRVSLLDASGRVVGHRITHLQISSSYALTSVISRTCSGIVCPATGGNPAFTACQAGRCVDPRCAPAAPEYCGTGDCTAATDCVTHGECASATCASGSCLVVPSSARCVGATTCSADFHCVATTDGGPPDLGAPVDGGPTCPAHETNCTNGTDDDCDGHADCADSDCAGTACDDGNTCTYGDACGGGTCHGTAISCTSDACVTRTCNGTAACAVANQPDRTGCPDDGNPCTANFCASGACVALPVPDNTNYDTSSWNARCCGGNPVDIAADDGNCGVCGNSCGGMGCRVYFPYWSECNCVHDSDCRGTCYDGNAGCPSGDGAGFLCQCQTDGDCIGGQTCCMYGPPGCRHICKWGC